MKNRIIQLKAMGIMKKKNALKKQLLLLLIFVFGIFVNQSLAATPEVLNSSERNSFTEGDQQQIEITGTVSDAQTGDPLPGVNIVIQGTTQGTTTDMDGNYTIEAPTNANLVFSFVGYQEQTVSIDGREEINVSMQQAVTELEEVVAVGYGTKRRSELSSSVTVVEGDELEDMSTGNLSTKLQGQVAGLQISNSSGHPAQGASMLVHGEGSIGAGTGPLFVVDGVIGGNVNPNNIENITVLKDAAATGLYGSRAANGVVIITTKSGQAGETQVHLSSKIGPAFHRNNGFELMNAEQLYNNRRQAGINYYEKNEDEIGVSFEEWFNTQVPPSALDRTANWPELLTRTGYVNQHNLSVSGGNEQTTFYASADYFYEKGTMVAENFQRIDLRSNLEHQISDRFKLNFRINLGTEQHPNDPFGGQSSHAVQYYINMPWDPAYEEDGSPYDPYQSGYWFGNANANYFYQKEHYEDRTKSMHITPDVVLEAEITDWLTFSTHNRYNVSGTDNYRRFDKYSYEARSDEGRVRKDYSYSNDFTTSNRLDIDHSFSDHNLSAILGQEYSYYQWTNTQSVGARIPMGVTALDATASPKSVAGDVAENVFLSYFGQLNYNYFNRYYLTASLRGDASSRFGANNRWATFGSIAGSWRIANEDFFDISWIKGLKLKGSYGVTGNANIPNYLSLGTYSFSTGATYNEMSGALPARIPNPNLTWETAHTTNIGIELTTNPVKLELDIYNRINKNLLQNVPLSSLTGFTSQRRNIGEVRNRGIDLNLTTTNIDRGNWNWSTRLNLNFNRNEVLTLYEGTDVDWGNFRISEGQPMKYFYMKKWAGVDKQTGKPLWIRWENDNGELIHGADHQDPANVVETSDYNRASNLFIEPGYPDITGGLINNVSYKNFSFNITTYYNLGQKIYFGQRRFIDDDGMVLSKNQMVPKDDWIRWEEPGDDATHPELLLGGNSNAALPSSRWLENGSFLRIQNVTLSYRFPNVLSGMTVQIIGNNLYTFSGYSGMNPDVNVQSPTRGQGDPNKYASPRKVMLGIELDF
jgi:TonB-linked SusC/RagA family outer membrane protein